MAYDRIQSTGETGRYDEVLVDEAQDLTVMAMRVVAALRKPEGVLLVSYDPAQSIYERGFRWKNCGIPVHGSRSFELRNNFRNTAEILGAARPLLDDMKDTLDTGEARAAEEMIEPAGAQRHGPPPRFVAVDAGSEYETLVNDIVQLIKEKEMPPQNIAVLCYPNSIRDKVFERLISSHVRCQRHDDETVISLSDTSVKVFPIKSAKGLEFPVVYLLATGANFKPPFDGDTEQKVWLEQMGRCFYMALTRAMSQLTVIYDKNDPAPFLKAIPAASRKPATSTSAAVGEGRPVGASQAASAQLAAPPPPTIRQQSDAPVASKEEVVVQGRKTFHRKSCKWLKSSASLQVFASRAEALKAGFRPCNTCKP
jgi:superfamily I DNA/RNA helicase